MTLPINQIATFGDARRNAERYQWRRDVFGALDGDDKNYLRAFVLFSIFADNHTANDAVIAMGKSHVQDMLNMASNSGIYGLDRLVKQAKEIERLNTALRSLTQSAKQNKEPT